MIGEKEAITLNNTEIRTFAKASRVRLWQIAEALGMQDSAFSRKLRKELPKEEKEQILCIIKKLSREVG